MGLNYLLWHKKSGMLVSRSGIKSGLKALKIAMKDPHPPTPSPKAGEGEPEHKVKFDSVYFWIPVPQVGDGYLWNGSGLMLTQKMSIFGAMLVKCFQRILWKNKKKPLTPAPLPTCDSFARMHSGTCLASRRERGAGI